MPVEVNDGRAAQWRRALLSDPYQRTALSELVSRARDARDWVRLALLQTRRFAIAETSAQRAEIALELARVEHYELYNPVSARAWITSGIAAAPEATELYELLAQFAREQDNPPLLLEQLEHVIRIHGDQTPAEVLIEAASLHAQRRAPQQALAYLQRATSRTPEHTAAVDALIDLLAKLERHGDLADALERRIALTANANERAQRLTRLAELQELQLFDPEAALDAFDRAAALDPSIPGIAEAIVRLRAKVESHGEGDSAASGAASALASYEREALVTTDRARLGVLVREIDRLHERLGTPDSAIEWIERWAGSSPDEPDALRALARAHARPGSETKLVETLHALDRLLEPSEQLANRKHMAELHAALIQPAEAERAFAAALAIEPNDAEALEGRAVALRVLRRTDELIPVLEQLAEHQPQSTRLCTRVELARLHEQRTDLASAIAVLARAEAEDGASGELTEQLDAWLAQTQRHEELEQRLARRAAGLASGSEAAIALELRRAAILDRELGRPELAATVYRDVLESVPESAEARAGLERALRASSDVPGLVAFLADRESRSGDAAERDQLALERARLLERALGRHEEALSVYGRLAADSAAAEVRSESEQRCEPLLEQLERWAELRDLLTARLGRGSASDDAGLHERLALLCADRLADRADEVLHWERLVALEPGRSDVWQVLARYYERADRTDDWVRALEAELATRPDHTREVELRARLAELYRTRLAQPSRARAHYERVFELCPSHNAAAQFLTAAYEGERRFEDLIGVLEARLASLDSADADPLATHRRTALRLQIAHVRDTHLDDLEGAISALEVALEEVGPEPAVTEPLAAAYRRGAYHGDLIALCERAIGSSEEAGERANWLVRLGDVHLGIDQQQEAADAYHNALAERPGDRAIEASLRELYRALGRSEPLVELLETELRHLAGTAEIAVRLELVERQRAAQPASAWVHASRVLQLSPRHRGAVEAATEIAESLGRHEEALAVLESRIRASQTALEACEWQIRRARLLAGPLARPGAAIDSYRAALDADPSGQHASQLRGELASVFEREQRWSEWLDCLASQVRECASSERAQLIERAALVAWDRISPEAALPWLERLRRERPNRPEVLARISLAHRELGNVDALLRALEEEAVASTGEARQRCHLERAALLRAAGERGRALSALADAGPVPEALRLRESLERELGLHARRAVTLEALLAGGPDLAVHRELASLYARELAKPQAAALHWEAARKLVSARSPAAIEILSSLAAAERKCGRTSAWARHAEAELAALDPTPVFDDRRRELRRELALAYDEELARPDAALAHLRTLLDATDVELLGRETRDRLELACLRLLRAEAEPVELERRMADRLARVGGSAEEWLELALLREESLQRTSAALDAYRKALDSAPSDVEALRGLRRTAERLGRWSDVADALERELECAQGIDPADRGALLRALADIHWHRLSSTTRASRYYAAALEANAADFAALRALERLLEAMEDWRGALDLYASEAEVLGSANPRRRREIWLHVAVLARDHAGEPERARQALRLAGEIEPLDAPLLAELAALHEQVGDRDAFAAALAAWCDAPEANATAADHVRLAVALEQLGRTDAAVARIEAAIATHPDHPAAWDTAARLRAAAGDRIGSACALRRAADFVSDGSLAAERLCEASSRARDAQPETALEMLRAAVERSPESGAAHAARARLAAQLGRDDEAELAARAALEITPRSLDAATLAAAARAGAEAARRRDRDEMAASLYAQALSLEPDDSSTLGAYGETLVALGDHLAARRALEQRLSRGDRYAERAAHCALLGRCLELAGQPEEALVHYDAALHCDALHPVALESIARVLESLDRIEPGIRAFERWARAARAGGECAERLLRAAQWEVRRGGLVASAERHLRAAVTADPSLTQAWLALAELQIDEGRLDDAIESTDRGGMHVRDLAAFAGLANLQGRAHEQKGSRREAALLFGIAAECDPRRVDAALAQARLLRGFGEWREAAAALTTFAERHPSGDDAALAEVCEQVGRLRAGPLEDLAGAVLSYRRAIELAPDRIEARAALAELLSQRPGDWAEALEQHRVVLERRPTHAGCLRAALRIARGRGDAAQVATGVAIQRALGIASAYESEADAHGAAPLVTRVPVCSDPRAETLRRIAVEAARELADALGGSAPAPENAPSGDPVLAFRSRMLSVQGELSAPALLAKSPREVREVMLLLVQLLLDPSHVNGDGALVNALSSSLGRRRRKKLRRMLPEDARPSEFAGVDFDAWRTELRALAAAEALRRDGTPLRTALAALVADAEPSVDLASESHLAPLIEAEPAARALLQRVVDDWLERL